MWRHLKAQKLLGFIKSVLFSSYNFVVMRAGLNGISLIFEKWSEILESPSNTTVTLYSWQPKEDSWMWKGLALW